MPKSASEGIAYHVSRLVDNTYDLRDVAETVRVCHSLAVGILRTKAARGKLHPEILEYDLSALAYDFIGELFRRDESHRFIQFAQSFAKFGGQMRENAEVLVFLRKIIANKVEAGIFRTYREIDPVFSKILRNVKLILTRCSEYHSVDRLGETYVHRCPESEIQKERLEFPHDLMEKELLQRVAAHDSFEQILQKFFSILNDQSEYRRIYPLVGIVGILKSCYVALSTAELHRAAPWIQDQQGFTKDVKIVVDQVIDDVQARMRSTYVGKGKLSEADYDGYFGAIRDLLDDLFVHQDGECGSYYDYLARQLRSLALEDYRLVHRARFEYLVKICKEEARKELKTLL
jgi:hypothetical protein